jgi:hypothetical protein
MMLFDKIVSFIFTRVLPVRSVRNTYLLHNCFGFTLFILM